MQWNECNVINAMEWMQWNECNVINAIWWMVCNECNVIMQFNVCNLKNAM